MAIDSRHFTALIEDRNQASFLGPFKMRKVAKNDDLTKDAKFPLLPPSCPKVVAFKWRLDSTVSTVHV